MPALAVGLPGTSGLRPPSLRSREELPGVNIEDVRDPDERVHGDVAPALLDPGVVGSEHPEAACERLLGLSASPPKLPDPEAQVLEDRRRLPRCHGPTFGPLAGVETESYKTSLWRYADHRREATPDQRRRGLGFRPRLGGVALVSERRFRAGRAPGTSTRSAGVTPRICARSNTIWSVGFRSPRSSSTYQRYDTPLAATCCCVIPVSHRALRRFRPKRRRKTA